MEFINLTRHPQRLIDENGNTVHEWPEIQGRPASVIWTTERTTVDGLPVVRKRMTGVRNLPEPQHATGYLVSREVAYALLGVRHDVYFVEQLVPSGRGRGVKGGRRLVKLRSAIPMRSPRTDGRDGRVTPASGTAPDEALPRH